MYYTIKTLSDLVGLTPQTIRYYEEKGLLEPKRDSHNGYRYYTVWDYVMLLTARRYLRYGCSVAQISDLLNNAPIEDSIDMAKQQEAQLEEEIADRLRTLESLRSWRQELESIGSESAQCRIGMRPGLFRLENMEDITFIDEKEIYQRTQQWFSMMPQVFSCMRYPKEDVENDTDRRFSAPGILEKDAARWGIREDKYVTYYPPRLCVIQMIGGEGFDTMLPLSRRIGGALQYMHDNGLSLTDDVITRMETCQKGGSGYRSYQTAWLPIDRKP